jgi:hypothetical protein
MIDLRALRHHVADLARSSLPADAIEADESNGTLWCTTTTAVILEEKADALAFQVLNSRLTHARSPGVLISSSEAPPKTADRVIQALKTRWTVAHALTPLPPPIIARCGANLRTGIDIPILSTQRRVESTHYWLRDHTGDLILVDDDPEASMVQRYLQLLSILVDTAQSSLAALAAHALDRTVIVMQRLLVEYAVRARYAIQHPIYTLWNMTVGEAQDYRNRLVATGADQALIDAATETLVEAEIRFPELTAKAKAERWKDITFKTMFLEVATREQHASLYRFPSIFIHGDPSGMRNIFRINDRGIMEGVIHLSDAELNSDLIDATAMLIEFLRAYQAAFPALAASDEATMRIARIDRENMIHSLRFPEERDQEYLAQVRAELGLD